MPVSTNACAKTNHGRIVQFHGRETAGETFQTVMPMQNRLPHMAAVVLSMPLPSAI